MNPERMEVEVTLKAKITFDAGYQFLVDPQEVRDMIFEADCISEIVEGTPKSGFDWSSEMEILEYSEERVQEASPCGGTCGTCEGKAMYGGSGEVPDDVLCTKDVRIHNYVTGESRWE
jgi:hypothetical protein